MAATLLLATVMQNLKVNLSSLKSDTAVAMCGDRGCSMLLTGQFPHITENIFSYISIPLVVSVDADGISSICAGLRCPSLRLLPLPRHNGAEWKFCL